ncbi:MAG TPA: DUF4142 domain-containing protein [Oculatellaceae cyanobacterium]
MRYNNTLLLGLIIPACINLPAQADTSKAESDLLSGIAKDGMLEVKLGKLAEEKAADAGVKSFAAHMVRDHSQANDKLANAAAKDHVTLPSGLSSDQQRMFDSLAKLSGADFDKKYVAEMVAGHDKAVSAIRKEKETGTGNSKAWAIETLPTVEEHRKEAVSLSSKVGRPI